MNVSFLLFCALLTAIPSVYSRAPFRSKKSPRETIHNYDIVYLELLSSDSEVYPRLMQVAIKSVDSSVLFNLDLTLNEGLLAPHFTSVHHEGKESTEITQSHANCFYHGTVKGRSTWKAVFSSCHGLRGWFGDLHDSKESVYHLEPLNDSKELSDPYVLYKDTEHKQVEPGTCGTPDRKDKHHLITTPDKKGPNHRVKKAATASNTGTNIVELLVVNDYHQYQFYSNNISAVVLRAVEVINHVDWLYSAIGVRVSLVHSLTWTASQQIANENEAGALLGLFKTYHSNYAPFRSITHDSAQMITGINLAGSTIGIAYVGTMCSYDNSVGVTQDTRGSVASVATTAAHEMGHTFDMDHDDAASCNCPVTTGQGCIMNAAAGFPPATNWSQCSINELNNGFVNANLNRCLGNNPTTIVGDARCGNGIREPGETCDCGSVSECNDPCCNATTCTLNDDADCGSGVCCKNCKFIAYGTTCRNSSGDCDLMEYCTGESADCPQDVSFQNGFPCNDDTGYCYGGQCGTHASQCLRYYGNTATPSNELCYSSNNVRGEGYGHCGSNGQNFIACSAEDVQCGSLQCQGGSLQNVNTRHSYVSYTNFRSGFQCRSFSTPATVDEISPGLVTDGTRCGNSSLCVSQRCVTLTSLSISPCPLGSNGETCSGNGVCNNLDTCSCNVGFTGANCGLAHGESSGGSSSNSGDVASSSIMSSSTISSISTTILSSSFSSSIVQFSPTTLIIVSSSHNHTTLPTITHIPPTITHILPTITHTLPTQYSTVSHYTSAQVISTSQTCTLSLTSSPSSTQLASTHGLSQIQSFSSSIHESSTSVHVTTIATPIIVPSTIGPTKNGGIVAFIKGNSVVGGVVGGIFVVIVLVAVSVVVIIVVLLVIKNRRKSVDLRASPSKTKYSHAPTNKKVTVALNGSNDLLMNERPYAPQSQTSSQPPPYNPYIPPTYSPSGGSGSPSVTVNNTRVPPPRPAPLPPISNNKPPTRAPPPKPPANRPPPPGRPSAPPKPQTAAKPSRLQWPPPSSSAERAPPPPTAKKPIPPPRK